MGEFKDGGFKIATKSKAPVVPVGITGTNDILENHLDVYKRQDQEFLLHQLPD